MKKTTRGAKGGGTIRKRSEGRWEARFTVGYDPLTGKQVQRSVYAPTQAEARKKLSQAVADIDEGTYTEPSRLTLGQWLDMWFKDYTADLKPQTLKSYETHIRVNIKPYIGNIKLSALTAHDIQALYNQLSRGTPEKKPLSPKTIKNLHGVLHKALQQAVELFLIRVNTSDPCKLPRVQKADIAPLNEYAIKAFLEAIQGHPYEALFIVDVFTGMRQSEIIGLTWDCIDFDKGTIRIYRQLQKVKGEYIFTTLKNDKARRITPAPYVMQTLKRLQTMQYAQRLKAGSAWQSGGFVFTDALGGHLKHVTVYKNFKRIAESIGIPAARFHDLRHTFAVASLQMGDDVKTVQENLGHHTAAFTLDVYGHVSERMKEESARRMEAFISGVKVSDF